MSKYRFRSAREWQIIEGMAVIAYAKDEDAARKIVTALNEVDKAKARLDAAEKPTEA